jgi:hypothetical protein
VAHIAHIVHIAHIAAHIACISIGWIQGGVREISNLMRQSQIRIASGSSCGKMSEELMREWDIKYQEAVDNYLERVKKKRESRIITRSVSGSGYETVTVTVTVIEQEQEQEQVTVR